MGIFVESNTKYIAVFLFASLMYWIISTCRSDLELKLYMAFAFTGTSLLIVERMNIDILTLPLVILISRLDRMKGLIRLLTFGFLLAFTLTKYYTAPLIYFFFIRRPKKEALVYLIFSVIALPIIYKDIRAANLDSFDFGYAATYGFKVLLGLFSGSANPTFGSSIWIALVGITFFLFLCLLFFNLYTKEARIVKLEQSDLILFQAAFILFFTTWLVSTNYPYRLTATLVFIPLLTRVFRNSIEYLALNLSLLFATYAGIHITLSLVRNVFILFLLASLVAILASQYMAKKTSASVSIRCSP